MSKCELVKCKWNRVYRKTDDNGNVTYEWYVVRAGAEIPVHRGLPEWLRDFTDRVLLVREDAPADPAERASVSVSPANYEYAKQVADAHGISVDTWVARLIGAHRTRKRWNR